MHDPVVSEAIQSTLPLAVRNWKLSPSDFAFLWEECKRCFYLKAAGNFPRPHGLMPKIFTVIDNEMKKALGGRRTETIAPGMPPGVVRFGEKWVESGPIRLPGRSSTCFVRGKYDTVVRFDDGSFGVIDFKTSSAKPGHLVLYARQLHSYAHALEHPAAGAFALGPVSRLGLLVFEPDAFAGRDGAALLTGGLAWVEIQRDDRILFEFLGEVLDLLDRPTPPEPSPDCEWCQYRSDARRLAV